MLKSSTIYDVAMAQRQKLLDGEQKSAQQIVEAYELATLKISHQLDVIVKKTVEAETSGIAPSPAWAYQAHRYQALLLLMEIEIAKANRDAEKIIIDRQRLNALMAQENVRDLFTAGHVTGSFIGLHNKALEAMVGHLADGSPLADLFQDISANALHYARRVLPDAISRGINPRKTAKVLAKEINQAAMSDLERITSQRALVIARTEQLRSYRFAQDISYKVNSRFVTGWRSVSARDGRTCPVCIAFDGTEHDLAEPFMGWHIQCRCTTVPVLRYSDHNIGTGEDWFASLSEERQSEILGSSRFELYRDGTSLQDMVTSKDSEKWGTSWYLKPLRDLKTP